MKELESITLFAKQLSESRIVVRVPAVRVLGIAEGEYDLQRFIYHHFFKNFWNPALSLTDNIAVNYDWYHPQLCSRHSLEEVEGWFQESRLSIVHSCADAYGITVRGVQIGRAHV